MRKPVALTVGVVLIASAVTGCSGDAHESPQATQAGAVAAQASADEIAFAQLMIPHHEQAVEMADLALASDSGASAQVQRLAADIKQAQQPEIDRMTTWLTQWGAPTAMPSASGGAHSGHDMGSMTEHGMMNPVDLERLGAATGREFDGLWLQMMISHHQGAIQMAEQVKQASANPEVIELADTIITTQQFEIATMQKDLAALGSSSS